MRAILADDIVAGLVSGDINGGVEIPADRAALPPGRLRWDGAEIIDAAAVTSWYVDAAGLKHLAAAPGRQALTCAWDAPLLQESGTWRVKSPVDRFKPIASAAVQAHIDAVAQARDFGDGALCASYAASTNAAWAADAAAFVSWRDDVWEACYAILADVVAENRPIPTLETVIAELPVITWPS